MLKVRIISANTALAGAAYAPVLVKAKWVTVEGSNGNSGWSWGLASAMRHGRKMHRIVIKIFARGI